MGFGRIHDRTDLWLPALVGLVGALVSLAGWGWMVGERRARILGSARVVAAETGHFVEVGLERQMETLRDLRDLWRDFDLPPADEWQANVSDRVDRVPGLASVAWIDLDQPELARFAGSPDTLAPTADEVAAAHAHTEEPAFRGPEIDAGGDVLYHVFMGVVTAGGRKGVLIGAFCAGDFLEDALAARARGYALDVLWNERSIFSRDTPSADPLQDWWRVEEAVRLPLGGEWKIVHRPTAQLAAARLTPIPHYLLATGFLLSIVLAVLVYQLHVIARQSRFLAATNRALDERRRELETRVAERTEELEDAVSELRAFNYSVSHDLRSPLGAILNFTTILGEDYRGKTLDEEGVRIVERIGRSAERGMQLLEGLLSLSRAGRAALAFEPVDMTSLARESFAQVRAAEDDAEVEFVLHPLPDTSCDRGLIADVFENLFSNALKYSRSREKRRIEVVGSVEAGECVYAVRDNGIGFDMRFADKLFGLFERLHSPEEAEGTGVGLAMVARIVKRHGGRVWASGRVDGGACFSFALPRRITDGPERARDD